MIANKENHTQELRDTILKRVNTLSTRQKKDFKNLLVGFLDQSQTGKKKATALNTKEEQVNAIKDTHSTLLGVSSDLYMVASSLAGTHYNTQLAIENLIFSKRVELKEIEKRGLYLLASKLPKSYLMRMFVKWKKDRLPVNRRVRSFVLTCLFEIHDSRFLALNFKRKFREVLYHVWGSKAPAIVNRMCSIYYRTYTNIDVETAHTHLFSLLPENSKELDKASHVETIAFIFDKDVVYTYPKFVQYTDAKTNVESLRGLPLEVAQGLNSTYHKLANDEFIKFMEEGMTKNEKAKVSTRDSATSSLVRGASDNLSSYSLPKLYTYHLTQNEVEGISRLAKNKALIAKNNLDLGQDFECLGVVFDSSFSMRGFKGDFAPAVQALALRDRIAVRYNGRIVYSSYDVEVEDLKSNVGSLPIFEGGTNLANSIVRLLEERCDGIVIITDGYENTRAGITEELISLIRSGKVKGVSNNLYIKQFSPVFGAETGKVRNVLPQESDVIPITEGTSIAAVTLKSVLASGSVEDIVEYMVSSQVKEMYQLA